MAFITSFSSTSKEQRWVDQIRKKFIREVAIDISAQNPICIFSVPKSVPIFKPEAYLPHMIGLGPYHHMDPRFYDMERYKIATAMSFYNQTGLHDKKVKFQELWIDKIDQLDPVIRGCYHSYLDLNDYTLSWIMAIDGLFLLNLLQDCSVDLQGKRMARGSILSRDLMLLENQIPFSVLQEISRTLKQNSSEIHYDDGAELLLMMEHFCRANSPLKLASTLTCCDHAGSHLHLLDVMYQLIVNNGSSDTQRSPPEEEISEKQDNSEETEVIEEDMDSVCDNIGVITKIAMKFGIGRKILKPLQVIQDIPWDKVLTFSGLKIVKDPSKHEGPVVQEIKIPSVSSLHYYAGVEFISTIGGIRDIKFVEEEATLYLPVITLDVNSEVVLRNLAAYETAMNYSHSSSSLSQFVDLISGIIDNAEDAKLLKQKGIIKGDLTNDQIAELFNGINKATRNSGRTTTVANINKYYKKTLVVKIFKFMKKRLFSLSKVITSLFTVLLLMLLVLYSFCNFYGCPKLFGSNSS